MIDYFSNPVFWIGLGQIILIDIVLSGDNAVVIALAARTVPPHQQAAAIFLGAAGAIVARVALALVALELLQYPYLRIVGSMLLFWIAVQLLTAGNDHQEEVNVRSTGSLFFAIRTIVIADVVMSLDNVIGIVAAAKGRLDLLIIGLAISIPLIIFGSRIILKLMSRFPVIITIGAALLGWIAGEMLIMDPILVGWISSNLPWMHIQLPLIGHLSLAQIVGAILVVVIGKLLVSRAAAKRSDKLVDLAVQQRDGPTPGTNKKSR